MAVSIAGEARGQARRQRRPVPARVRYAAQGANGLAGTDHDERPGRAPSRVRGTSSRNFIRN